MLATTVPVHNAAGALERLEWYTACWLCADSHQCLKSGGAAERRDLEAAPRIERLLGFLALGAVRLLQVRQAARQEPQRPAREVMPESAVVLLAAWLKREPRPRSVVECWRGVARLGGFLGRRRDGPPGWKTLWRGWRELDAWLRGLELATQAALLQPHPATYG